MIVTQHQYSNKKVFLLLYSYIKISKIIDIVKCRVGKTGHRVVFMSCQFCVVSNLGRPKPDSYNYHVKILRPKLDTEK